MTLKATFLFEQIGGFGSCKGDSGGPLVYFSTLDGSRKYVQVGIVVGGIGRCGNNIFPGVYVRTSDKKVLDFIKSIMGSQVIVQTIPYNTMIERLLSFCPSF